MVGHVNRCINAIQDHQVVFDPFTEREVLYVDVPGLRGGFLCVAHCGTTVVVLIEDSCHFLCGILRSQTRMLWMYRIVLPVLHAAMNSALVLEPVTVGWKRHL
jgi:hypothetical protein